MASNSTLMIQDQFLCVPPSADTVPLTGVAPASPEHPLPDPDAFAGCLSKMAGRMGNPKRLTVTIPDVWTHTRVLAFDRIPLSLAKREEAIHWKMSGFLPLRPEDYDIQYEITGTDVLVAALARSARRQLTRVLDRVLTGCYRLIPESVHMVGHLHLPRDRSYRLFLVVRELYVTGLVMSGDHPVVIRSRPRSDRVSLEEEVALLMNLSEELTGHRPQQTQWIGTGGAAVGERLHVEWMS